MNNRQEFTLSISLYIERGKECFTVLETRDICLFQYWTSSTPKSKRLLRESRTLEDPFLFFSVLSSCMNSPASLFVFFLLPSPFPWVDPHRIFASEAHSDKYALLHLLQIPSKEGQIKEWPEHMWDLYHKGNNLVNRDGPKIESSFSHWSCFFKYRVRDALGSYHQLAKCLHAI